MKKQMIRASLLVLAVLAVVLIHKRVQYEAEEAEKLTSEAMEQAAEEAAAEASAAVRLNVSAAPVRIEPNGERGGIDIIVTAQNGTEMRYSYTDVSAEDWFADAVAFAVSEGLMEGVDGGLEFQPDYGITRESFAAILYRFSGGEKVKPERSFDDVSEEEWYHDAVSWVTNERLMAPLGDGVFGVGEFVTCEQALTGLYRVADEPGTDGSLAEYPYAAKVSDAGRDAVDWAWKNGLIAEDECVWYPTQAISRAQVALLLMRFAGHFA